MKRLRKKAKELLHAAGKVHHYRRDVVSNESLEALDHSVLELETLVKDKTAGDDALQAAMKHLDELLYKIGGKIYPKTFWSDHLEVLLVAAILVIGVRTFFFQPFIIPTNSMYPTYNGMTARVYTQDEASPSGAQKLFNKLTLGARHKSVFAGTSGKLLIPIDRSNGNPKIFKRPVKGRKWLFIPAVLTEYTFYVDNFAHTLQVPAEFAMDKLLSEQFTSGKSKIVPSATSLTGFVWDVERVLDKGDPIIRFDINLGDALFVDRISYHFKRPKVGDPFVFRTDEISAELERLTGDGTEKYYIKRLAGVGGETLEIRDGALFANGELRDEVAAFVRNAEKEGEYNGYVNQDLLAKGRKLAIPKNSYVALGDNSSDSLDSRFWGFVPDKSVIGKAIFIYYPFTKRWGLAE